jgi:tRNA(Ile)-lysidine synthetase-like protein
LPPGVHVTGRAAVEIDAAARDGRGTRWFDVEGGRVRVSYGQVHIEPAGGTTIPREAPRRVPRAASVTIPQAGVYPASPTMALAVREGEGPGAGNPSSAGDDPVLWTWFDGDGLAWPLHIRFPLPGDRMFPRGSTGSRKLSDLLIDAKVPRAERPSLPVVTDGEGTILFVPGLRPSRAGTPGSATLRRIGLAVVPISDHDGSVDPSIVTGNTERCLNPKGLL